MNLRQKAREMAAPRPDSALKEVERASGHQGGRVLSILCNRFRKTDHL